MENYMENNLLPLCVNLAEKNNDYIVFLGAGFSKDAGIKSGWEILIDTLKPLFVEENKDQKLDENYMQIIEKWYLEHPKYSKLGYSDILELVYPGPIERREYLKKLWGDKYKY